MLSIVYWDVLFQWLTICCLGDEHKMDNQMHNDGYTMKDAAKDTVRSSEETARKMKESPSDELSSKNKGSWHKSTHEAPKSHY